MSLTNESVVVITGAASGIGRALAVRLAREQITGIAISDVNENGLNETARIIQSPNLRVSTHIVNVSDLKQMQNFRDEMMQAHGRITHLINNAGVALFGTIEEVSLEDIEWLMSINFWGTVYGVKLFLPILREQPVAHIVNLSSVFGMIAPPGNAAYSASKFAVRGFTEALRHELKDTSVAVSCVHPGGIATNIARDGKVGEKASDKEKEESVKYHTKLSRTSAEQAAEIILKGIKKRSKRILVGMDAHLIDIVNRLTPENYLPALDLLSGGQMSEMAKKMGK
ncbi:MAG: SDR family NAD(P)-dependent oxidoreductase [Pyrinomonadaceae bacterium]